MLLQLDPAVRDGARCSASCGLVSQGSCSRLSRSSGGIAAVDQSRREPRSQGAYPQRLHQLRAAMCAGRGRPGGATPRELPLDPSPVWRFSPAALDAVERFARFTYRQIEFV
jgi:hypothetical protein